MLLARLGHDGLPGGGGVAPAVGFFQPQGRGGHYSRWLMP